MAGRAGLLSATLPGSFDRLFVGVALVATLGCRPRSQTDPPDPASAEDVAEILAGSHLPALVPTPLAGDPLGVTIHRLANGLTVYISTVRDEPRVQGWIAVRAGGRHDPPHATGLAHYLEHMLLFKGTDEIGTIDHAAETPHLERTRELYRSLAQAKSTAQRERVLAEIDTETLAVARTSVPNELLRLYDRLGFTGSDGHTYSEKTWYHTQMPANRVDAWATITAEQFGDPVFRLFYPELEAVYEEKNRGLDSAERRMYESMMRALFPAHPYGTQTVLGEPEHLKTPAFDEMVAFFERWYVPNNMAIILAGDVDASVLPELEARFGRLKPRKLESLAEGELAPLVARAERTITAPGEPSVMIAWPTVAIDHADAVAVELVLALLDDARIGTLSAGLVRPGKAAWAGAWGGALREAGYLVVEAPVRDDTDHAAIEAELRAAVARLREVTPGRLAAIKLRAAMDRALAAERSEPRATRMMEAFVGGLDWSEVVAREERFDALGVADVVRVVDRYLGEASVVVKRARGAADPPKLAKPKITPLVFAEAKQSPFGERVAAMPAAAIEPAFVREEHAFTRVTRASGEVIAAKNAKNELFSLVVVVDRGFRAEPLLCHALEVWMQSGTTKHAAAALQERLFELGATVAASCDDERVALHVTGVDRNFAATVALVREWWTAPSLARERVSDAAKTAKSARMAALDDDDAITGALRNRAYFGRESAQLLLPSHRELEAASAKQLRELVIALPKYRHRVLYYGPRPAAEVAGAALFGAGTRAPEERWARSYRRIDRTEVHVVHRGSAKANVHVLFAGAGIASGRETTPSLVGWELGRRAWDDIRGARALAYSVRAGIDHGRLGDDAALWGFLQAQPDKVAQAVPALLAVLGVAKLDPVALVRARGGIRETLRTQRTDPRAIPAYVDAWRDRGLDRDPRSVAWDDLDEVTPESTAALLELLHGRPAIITVVGDTSRIDLDALAEIGTVQLHEPRDLFSFE